MVIFTITFSLQKLLKNNEKTFKGKFIPSLIAEIGGNYEGDFVTKIGKLALLIEVDVIKLQIYYPDNFSE